MRKFPLILTLLVVGAVVMATAAFTRPLAVRNGVVTDYSAGSSMTIRGANYEQTYSLRGMEATNGNSVSNDIAGLGVGARVTVFAECSGSGKAAAGSTGLTSAAPSGKANLTAKVGPLNNNAESRRFSTANANTCVALFVIVHEAVANSATGGTTPAASTTPAVTATPAVTGTPSGGTLPLGTATPTP